MKPALAILLASVHVAAAATYVGSATCKTCHPALYARWSKTRMANVVRDPRQSPESVLGDFSKPNPLVNFKPSDVAFVYGSKWKQRYFYKRGDDYFVYPAQWDIPNQTWRAYHPGPGTDWWVPFYGSEQSEPALRRLPLGRLRAEDARRGGVERRLRKMSWSRQRPRCEARAHQHRQSGAPRLRAR